MFFGVYENRPAHTAIVIGPKRDLEDLPVRLDHYDLRRTFSTAEEAEAFRDALEECPAAKAGRYCYNHNPSGR